MKPSRFSLLAAGALAIALLASPSGALGAANHPLLHATSGKETPNQTFEDACGLAFEGGGLYVSDYYHDAIDLFNSEQKFQSQFSEESKGGGPCKLAADSSEDLYVLNWHQDVVRYETLSLSPGAGTVIDADFPTGLAVDRATGNVYIAHRTYIAEYDHGGTHLATIGLGNLQEAYGVAFSEFPATAGYLYVPDAGMHTVKVFNPSVSLSVPVETLGGENTPQGRFAYLRDSEIVVDNNSASPSYGHVYVLDAIGHGFSDHPEGALDEFNSTGAYRGQIRHFVDAEPSAVAISPEGQVFLTSGNTENSQVLQYGPTAPPQTLTVEKTGNGEGSITTSPGGVDCGSHCTAEFNEEQLVTLFATPDGHSVLTGWTVVGSEPCPGAGSCQVIMDSHVEVQANFAEPTQETLNVGVSGEGTVTSSPEGISCPSSCEEHYAQGRLVTLTATPASHNRFVEWLGPDCDESTQLVCKVQMSQAKAISAEFEPIPQLPMALALAGTGQGTVTSYPPGISCPGTCSSSFDEGSTVYLMGAPSPGSSFGGFAGGGCAGTATLCAVPMSQAQSVSATFIGAAAGPADASTASLAAADIKVAMLAAGPAGALLSVKTSEAGTLLASGGGLKPLRRGLSSGATTLRLRLGRAARERLVRHRRLVLRLAVGFLPVSGASPVSRSLRLRFHAAPPQASKRRRRGRP
jgi:DNA-binding beta-propeller fold protein YncE